MYRSLTLSLNEAGNVQASITEKELPQLKDGEVLISVKYSSVNYKDALASMKKSGVVPAYPITGGIDAAGIVTASKDTRFKAGDEVIATSYGIGVTQDGGYGEYLRVPSDWVVPLPSGLSLKDAMILGTAGLTSALSVDRLLTSVPDLAKDAPLLVSGATGGVGSINLQLLRHLGFQNITALSRKAAAEENFLKQLGATHVTPPEEILPEQTRPLMKQNFTGVLDTIGGSFIGSILPQIAYDGALVTCGNASGIQFSATVLPFILRGVKLVGVDSVQLGMKKRQEMWDKLAGPWQLSELLSEVITEIGLTELPEAFQRLLNGTMKGRYLVHVQA